MEEPKTEGKKLKQLTAKQKLFCESWVKCQNASQAAREAGYSGLSVPKMASDLMKLPHVQQYCASLLEKSFEDSEISVAFVLRSIQAAISTAIDKGDVTNHLRALDMLGKYLKMWEKVEQNCGVTVVIASGIPHAPGLQQVVDVTPQAVQIDATPSFT